MEQTAIRNGPTSGEAAFAFIPLGEVAGWLRTNGFTARIHTSIPYRWFARGILLPNGERVRLSCLKFGKRLCTTPGALIDFASKLGQGGSFRRGRRSARPQSRPPEQRDRDVAAAEGRLTDAGI